MKKNTLPKFIQPLELADRNAVIAGSIHLKQLSRIAPLIVERPTEVQVTLKFGKDSEGFRYISGTINTQVWLVCQRCLQPFAYPIDIVVQLSPISSTASAKALPERYEPLIITEEPILLSDLIEDELLLALPMVAKHPLENCSTL